MSMQATVLRQKMSREEAWKIAERKGDWLWNLVFNKHPLTELRLMYIEYVLLELETASSPTLVSKLKKAPFKPIRKNIQVLVNGSTGGVALVGDNDLKIEDMVFDDNTEYQLSAFDHEEVVKRAKMLAHKVTHRTMGGMHEAEIVGQSSLYRPFWVAFYGEVREGNRVRYITIPADGGHNNRVR